MKIENPGLQKKLQTKVLGRFKQLYTFWLQLAPKLYHGSNTLVNRCFHLCCIFANLRSRGNLGL